SVTLTPSSGNVSRATALQIAVTLTGATPPGTPTGTITVSGGGYSTNQPLTAGAVTITIPAGTLTPGTDMLTITYSGDSNYASVSQTETVNVAAAIPLVTVTAPDSDN